MVALAALAGHQPFGRQVHPTKNYNTIYYAKWQKKMKPYSDICGVYQLAGRRLAGQPPGQPPGQLAGLEGHMLDETVRERSPRAVKQ